MYNPRDIIDLIATNVRKTRNPFGVPASRFNTWWRQAPGSTRRPGDALLFTGMMYQAIPYIEATTRLLERFEGTRWADYLRFGRFSRYLPGSLPGRGLSWLISPAENKKFNDILVAICRLLTKSGVNFFYHPEMDFYSGILLYDLGDQDGFVEHAKFVARTLRLHGVQKIITVDPHTTYALKELYPKYTGETFEVTPYFTRLNLSESLHKNGQPPVTIHDPCFYGRYLKLSEGPRQVLRDLGLGVCGGAELRRVHLLLRRPGGVGIPGPEPGDFGPEGGGIAGDRRPGGHHVPHLSGQSAQGGPARGGPGQPGGPLLLSGRLTWFDVPGRRDGPLARGSRTKHRYESTKKED